jgi:uncharacterized membrane protein (UPF0127 family)
MTKHLVLAAILALAACSPQQQAAASSTAPAEIKRHPVSGLEVVPLTITQDGKVHSFKVEVASSEEEQATGLMFRKQMGADEGMIFPRTPPDFASFWMRNTVMSLDMIFIGTDRRIINIDANTVPYSLDSHPSQGLASAVLELNGGRAAQLGIKPGAKVDW